MRQTVSGFDAVTITASDHNTKATIIPERGAWVSSIIFPFQSGDREILFQHDYAWNQVLNDLPGGLPFLFPVCARICRQKKLGIYLYDGKQYELNMHGFSWYEKWEVNAITENSIELILRQNEHTLSQYPFRFEVRLKYAVLPGKLICHQVYQNHENLKSMPYYAGFHPYFLTPMHEKEKIMLDFESIRRFKYNSDLTDIIGEQSLIRTPVSIASPEINEQLSLLASNKSVSLTFPNQEQLSVNIAKHADLFPYLQLYTIPEKPFFCAEHWMAFPNAMNTVYGVRWLKPTETETAVYEITCRNCHEQRNFPTPET